MNEPFLLQPFNILFCWYVIVHLQPKIHHLLLHLDADHSAKMTQQENYNNLYLFNKIMSCLHSACPKLAYATSHVVHFIYVDNRLSENTCLTNVRIAPKEFFSAEHHIAQCTNQETHSILELIQMR